MTEKHQDRKVWYPLGEGSESRIVADLSGTACEKTVSIHAACELLPDEAMAFARQITDAVAWLRNCRTNTGTERGLFLKGAWIADPDALPNEEFHKRFCCKHWGVDLDFENRVKVCRYTGLDLVDLDHSGPIPIPYWCPKREVAR